MAGVLDLFLAQPLGTRSLLQRIFGLALGDGIKSVQRSIDALTTKINEPVFCEKIRNYTESDELTKAILRKEAQAEEIDLLVAVLRAENVKPALGPAEIGRAFNAYVAWNSAVENVSSPKNAKYEYSILTLVGRSMMRCETEPRYLHDSNNY